MLVNLPTDTCPYEVVYLSNKMNMFTETKYKMSVWWNPRGDLVKWIDNNTINADGTTKKLMCKAMVRREDRLVFKHTLSCYEINDEYYNHMLNNTKLYQKTKIVDGKLSDIENFNEDYL